MAFNLVKDPMDIQAEYWPISSLNLAAGDMLELDVGAANWTVADASTEHWQRKVVVTEAATSSDTEVKGVLVHDLQLWDVEAANTANSAHNGDRMLLTDQNTVNNSGSDNTSEEAIFIQKGPLDSTKGTRIIGYFVGGTGINPDAS